MNNQITRRQLFAAALEGGLSGAICSGAGLTVGSLKPRERPWAARAKELEPISHFPELSAFDEWLDDQAPKYWADFGVLDAPSRVALYYIMCDLVDGKAEAVA